jgi:hypothetical protein
VNIFETKLRKTPENISKVGSFGCKARTGLRGFSGDPGC